MRGIDCLCCGFRFAVTAIRAEEEPEPEYQQPLLPSAPPQVVVPPPHPVPQQADLYLYERQCGVRDRLRLANQFGGAVTADRPVTHSLYYLVVRGKDNHPYNPPLITLDFNTLRHTVLCVGDRPGKKSIFQGFRDQQAVRVYCEAAGLAIPVFPTFQ